MQKRDWTWTTPRFHEPARMLRWGHFGTPLLIFPTAGGDFDEIERFNLIGALSGLIDQGKLKVYSIDGLSPSISIEASARLLPGSMRTGEERSRN